MLYPRAFIFCILSCCFVHVFAQSNNTSVIDKQYITGKVYKAGTDTVIKGATVYYGGSMGGTTTSSEGEFSLHARSHHIPIIVSCIGYYSATESNYESGRPLVIYLKPKHEELNEVVIRADGMDRKEEIRIFTKEFLGVSEYARSCTITNINDINFFYRKKTKTLTANCDKPIIIENKKLGYTITYYLDKFEIKDKDVFIAGNSVFKETEDLSAQAKIMHNREDVYDGSKMQFIRALWYNTMAKAPFRMYIDGYLPLKESNIVGRDAQQQKYIHLPKDISIVSRHNIRDVNFLRADSDFVFIDKDGFYGSGLFWSGPIASQRVGDMLPFEYRSDKEQKDFAVAEALAARLATDNVNKQSSAKIIMPDEVKNQLEFEKTYLHTDRDIYTRGDTLWFKAYLVNAQNNTPANSSGNLHVELISPDAKVISAELIRMESGFGNGDFDLPDTLAAGKYRLRAYTNWMRNFGDNFVFEKEITVLAEQATVAPAGKEKGAVAVNSSSNHNTTPKAATTIPSTAALPIVRFYPEGGSLVEGINSIIAVKTEDEKRVSGAVLSATGDTIVHFKCDTLGMGVFAMLPVKGQVYHAVVNGRNYDLPPFLSAGTAIQVRQSDSLIRVVISNKVDPADTPESQSYRLTFKHTGITLLTKQVQLTSPQTAVKVSTTDLPEGIGAITLYNASGKPECERLVYIHHQNQNLISISSDKKTYQTKEKVGIKIDALPNANLSMAVVDADMMPGRADDIVSGLMLSSEVKGNVEHAYRYFDTTNVNRFKQLDLLLMTQGWRDFVWRRLADTTIRISYAAENGIAVTGKVEDEVNHKPMPKINVSLYADGAKGNKIFSGNTDVGGLFNFSGLMLYNKQNVKLASFNEKGEKLGSLLVDTIVPLPVKAIHAKINAEEDSIFKTVMVNKSVALQKANLKGVTQLKEVKVQAKRNSLLLRNGSALTTWAPDQVFNITPKDNEYKTLEWFLIQNTKGAQKSTIRDTFGVVYSGIDTAMKITYSNSIPRVPIDLKFYSKSRMMPPSLFVNGQELNMDENNTAENYRNTYFNMPINKFKKIVLTHTIGTLHGLLQEKVADVVGIVKGNRMTPVEVETTTVDRYLLYLTLIDDAAIDNPGSLSVDVSGYYQARTFYQPTPNAKPSLADYRSTIHWQPNIKTDAAGKATLNFYNGTGASKVKVIVQGISADGTPLAGMAGYEVN